MLCDPYIAIPADMEPPSSPEVERPGEQELRARFQLQLVLGKSCYGALPALA